MQPPGSRHACTAETWLPKIGDAWTFAESMPCAAVCAYMPLSTLRTAQTQSAADLCPTPVFNPTQCNPTQSNSYGQAQSQRPSDSFCRVQPDSVHQVQSSSACPPLYGPPPALCRSGRLLPAASKKAKLWSLPHQRQVASTAETGCTGHSADQQGCCLLLTQGPWKFYCPSYPQIPEVSASLQERAQQAAYAHIPLGNMGPDWMLSAADALFGRCLRDAKHLLWARDASLPALSQLPSLAEEDEAQLEPPAMDVRFSNTCCSSW